MSGKFTKILTETLLKNEKNFVWCQHGVSEFIYLLNFFTKHYYLSSAMLDIFAIQVKNISTVSS
jgi:hypothetical protein